jgi:UTP:GlnB (protein PII) uridylyltransferase
VEIERIERHDTPVETGGNSREIEVLERLLKAAEEQLADVKKAAEERIAKTEKAAEERIAKTEVERDKWWKQAQANQLLTHTPAPRKKLFGLF